MYRDQIPNKCTSRAIGSTACLSETKCEKKIAIYCDLFKSNSKLIYCRLCVKSTPCSMEYIEPHSGFGSVYVFYPAFHAGLFELNPLGIREGVIQVKENVCDTFSDGVLKLCTESRRDSICITVDEIDGR
jgi:hypothetical protein